jgi:hypothetical protein
MENLDLSPYLTALRRAWFWLLATAFIAGFVAQFVPMSPPIYKASAVIEWQILAIPPVIIPDWQKVALGSDILLSVAEKWNAMNGDEEIFPASLPSRLSISLSPQVVQGITISQTVTLTASASSEKSAIRLVNLWQEELTARLRSDLSTTDNTEAQALALLNENMKIGSQSSALLLEVQAQLDEVKQALINLYAQKRTLQMVLRLAHDSPEPPVLAQMLEAFNAQPGVKPILFNPASQSLDELISQVEKHLLELEADRKKLEAEALALEQRNLQLITSKEVADSKTAADIYQYIAHARLLQRFTTTTTTAKTADLESISRSERTILAALAALLVASIGAIAKPWWEQAVRPT